MLTAALAASQLPKNVTVTTLPSQQSVKDAVANGTLDGGVAVLPSQLRLHTLLVPIVDPGATHTPGFDVVTKGTSPLGQEYAESVAAGMASVMYADRVPRTQATEADDPHPATVSIDSQDVGHGGKVNLNFFAPNIAVVFLFIGSGLGMRSLLMERSAGTLARITAAPVRPTQIVLGKLLAIFLTGMATIFVIWAVTTYGFGADWGNLLGVLFWPSPPRRPCAASASSSRRWPRPSSRPSGSRCSSASSWRWSAATFCRRARCPTRSRCWRWARRTAGPWSGSAPRPAA